MNKIILLLSFLFLTVATQAQEVPSSQQSLIIKKTASWCPPCGEWGWDLFENLIEDNEDNAILWAMHYSGGLQNATTQGINGNLTGSGQPRFYINNVNISGPANDIQTEMKAGVIANADKTAEVNAIATNLDVSGESISVTVKSKFFIEAEGEYFLNVYIVEEEVDHVQAGRPDAMHEKVLRDDMAGDAFGVLLTSGTTAMNTSFSTDFSIPIAVAWDVNHIELSTVIWKKVGANYEFVNGTTTSSIILDTKAPLLKTAKMTIAPNPIFDFATIKLSVEESLIGDLTIYDSKGSLVQRIGSKNEINESTNIDLDVTNLKSGQYFVRFNTNKGQLTQKIIVQK